MEWFSKWLESAPGDDAIRDSILLLWTIWCMRNEATFHNVRGSIDNALSFFSGIVNLRRFVHFRPPLNRGDVCFWYVKQGVIVESQSFACFVTEGAWDKTSGREAAAWVQDEGAEEQQLG